MNERRHLLIAALLCIAATGILAGAGRSEGIPRDEALYFDAGERYWAWYGELGDAIAAGKPATAFQQASIDRWFQDNHEHPVLMKTLYGMSWRLFHKCHCVPQSRLHPVAYAKPHRTLPIFSDAQAMRFPAYLFGGLLVAMVYLYAGRIWSHRAGLVAAGLTLAAPRYFFHAELSCFDAPMVTTWFATIYCWQRSLTDSRWAWRTGLAFGLAMATKHNAFFLPFVLLAHYLWVRRDSFKRYRPPPFPLAFVWMALLGPLIEFAHWPWLWHDTVERFKWYLGFHLNHVYYNMEFLGQNYNKPPFPKFFPYVMTLLTAPVTTLALALGGGVALFLRRKRQPDPTGERPSWKRPAAGMSTAPGLLVALNAFFPLAIIAFTGAPIFGATKHFLPAIPFLALLAGYGLEALSRLTVEKLGLTGRAAQAFAAGSVLLAIAPAAAETWRSHPYALTHYNLIAGGPAGGADLGMNRQFWGYSTRGILPWLNAHAPRFAPIYWHDTFQPILNMNVREGLQRDDFGNTGLEEPGVKASNLAMVIHEKHFNKYEYWIWDFYGTSRPSLVLTVEGVPIVTLYERPRSP
ncbi:MAG: phospholipid carrier-dependent glycosyltransferase [Myxococcales bacterium]|nr:phospholipid carrier-dependent glycosyltransferase [Myxococcales bacterium]